MPRKTQGELAQPGAAQASFNEAAARCRGKLDGLMLFSLLPPSFNEAAARCRGKHPLHAPGNDRFGRALQ